MQNLPSTEKWLLLDRLDLRPMWALVHVHAESCDRTRRGFF